MNIYEIQERFIENLDPKLIVRQKHELQLDLFMTEEESEVERLLRIVEEIKTSTGAVRRKLFSENGSLKKRVLDLENRLEILERGICYENILIC